MKIITDARCTEYASPGHPERPARISSTVDRLRTQKELPITWVEPLSVACALKLPLSVSVTVAPTMKVSSPENELQQLGRVLGQNLEPVR